MDIKEFFEFSVTLSQSNIQFGPIDKMPSFKGMSYFHKLLIGDYTGFSFPLRFKQKRGVKLKDVLSTGTATLFLISDNLRNLLENHNLTGWKTFSVTLLNKNGIEILGYHGLSIVGRCGPIDYTKSKIIYKNILENGPLWKYYKGLHVGLDQWDGSDFFLPQDYFGTIVTGKTVELLQTNKITNLVLRNLIDIEIAEENV
jgi:hypothetical protein